MYTKVLVWIKVPPRQWLYNCPCLAKYIAVDVGRGIISLNFPHAALVWESAISSQPPPR